MLDKNGKYKHVYFYLNKKGYVRITDMGIARLWKLENNGDTSGTPGYMGK